MPLPEVSTFHAKGFDILGAAHGRKRAVSAMATDRTALQRFLSERFAARMRERAYRKRFSKWWVERRDYTPDFHLPDYDVWGGRLDDRLAARLEEARVGAEDPSGEALERLLTSVEDSFPRFAGLLNSFLELFRAGGWTRAEVQKGAESRRDREFLQLFWPLLDDCEEAFRLTPDVAALSSRFITKNPAQLEKGIIPRNVELDGPSVVPRFYDVSEAEGLQEVLEEISGTGGERVRVLVLGRYKHTLGGSAQLPFRVPENVELQGLTVHRAKGLEAGHVIVLGLESGRYGFPSEIEDDSVLRLLLAHEESFPNAEERRLFYVALTRARSRVYLFAPATDPSAFVQELLEDDYAAWIGSSKEWSAGYRCPRCRGRTIRRKEGPSGSFWGCTNYPACHGVLPVCFECGAGILEPSTGERGVLLTYTCSGCRHEAEVCPGCGVGALVPRDGPHGVFMGCSEWRWNGRGCGYTRGVAGARTSS